ncbi:atypical chemokine receptor 2-like [Argopecten irradians]|uniref:atypical chemokine receptor 2-like n=1 Tax=Argopecten irradians TaxID=31199 RepID=UPI00371C516F
MSSFEEVPQYSTYDVMNVSNESFVDYTSMTDSTLHDLRNSFLLYVLPTVVVVGTIGNLLTIVIIKKTKLREFSVGFYLYVYAIDNLLTIYMAYGLTWLSHIAGIPEVENLSNWVCRLWSFVYRMVMHSGIWFVTAALIDRYISIAHPDKAMMMCQVFMSKIAVLIIMIGMVFVSVHGMWSYELNLGGVCFPYLDLHFKIWHWTSALCYAFIPMSVLILLSMVILCGMFTRHQNPRVTMRDTDPSDLVTLVLSLALTFLVLSLPATILNIIYMNLPYEYLLDHDFMNRFEIVQHVTDGMTCGNPAILFFVCVVFSSSFRQEMKHLLIGWRKRRRSAAVNEMKSNDSGAHIVESQSNDTLL